MSLPNEPYDWGTIKRVVDSELEKEGCSCTLEKRIEYELDSKGIILDEVVAEYVDEVIS